MPAPFRSPLPGMPNRARRRVRRDARRPLRPAVARDPAYLYVPNSYGAPITTVIDQRTRKVVRVLHTGTLSQHVTPSYDLRTLYVEASAANRLVAIDPRTGADRAVVSRRPAVQPLLHPRRPARDRDGRGARRDRLHATRTRSGAARRPRPRLQRPEPRGLLGQRPVLPGHAASSPASLLKISTHARTGSLGTAATWRRAASRRTSGSHPTGGPSTSPTWAATKLLRIGWRHLQVIGHTDMPAMPHGIYPSRDGRRLYVSDRMAGEVSVVSLAHRQDRGHLEDAAAAAARTWAASPRTGGHAVAVRPLRRRRLRLGHPHRQAGRGHPRRRQPARPAGLAAARPVLARPHREPAVSAAARGGLPARGRRVRRGCAACADRGA